MLSFAAIISCSPDSQQQNQSNAPMDTSTVTINSESGLIEANTALYDGLNAMFTGDIEPLNKLWSHSENV